MLSSEQKVQECDLSADRQAQRTIIVAIQPGSYLIPPFSGLIPSPLLRFARNDVRRDGAALQIQPS